MYLQFGLVVKQLQQNTDGKHKNISKRKSSAMKRRLFACVVHETGFLKMFSCCFKWFPVASRAHRFRIPF